MKVKLQQRIEYWKRIAEFCSTELLLYLEEVLELNAILESDAIDLIIDSIFEFASDDELRDYIEHLDAIYFDKKYGCKGYDSCHCEVCCLIWYCYIHCKVKLFKKGYSIIEDEE